MTDNGRMAYIWRSLLYVPAHIERFVEKARLLDVDAVQLDLEDGVPVSDKDRARECVASAAVRAGEGGADIIVRINRPIGMAIRDIEESIGPHVRALNLPKVAGADHVRLLSEHMAVVEARVGVPIGSTRLIVTIETPEALLKASEIFGSDARIVGAILGAEDFAAATGALPGSDLLESAKKSLILAAAAAGVMPLGTLGSITNYRDVDGFRDAVRRSRACGFRGSSCIHPDQAAILNEEFSPSKSELAWAEGVIAGFDQQSMGAIGLDGEMIDLPVLKRAQIVLALKAKLDQRRLRRNDTHPLDLPPKS